MAAQFSDSDISYITDIQGEIEMSLSDTEFSALLADLTKSIEEDITWQEDEDHSPAVEFRIEVESDAGYPLLARGRYNAIARTLTFCLIHRSAGRIYALDMGKEHHNPDCNMVGDKHKHKYTERYRDKEAYVPNDITEHAENPVAVWRQFCEEANIIHNGSMSVPPKTHEELFL